MKIYPALKYLALGGLITAMGSCASNKVAQTTGEYDDLYFSSKDKKEVQYTASASSDNLKYDEQNRKTVERRQPNTNPDYVEPYTAPNKKARESYLDANNTSQGDNSDNAGDTYYDENYAANNPNQFGNIRPSLISNSNGSYYSPSTAYYDPYRPSYWSSYGGNAYAYDAFVGPYWGPTVMYRVNPQIVISFGTGWGWGSSWYGGRSYGYYGGYDPWGYSSWGYSGWGGYPYYSGFYGSGWYGGGWGGGWANNWYNNNYYYNTVVVGNTDRGRTIYRNNGPRTERSTDRLSNQGGRQIQRSGSTDPVTTPSRGGRIANDGANSNTSNGSIRPERTRTSAYDQPQNSRDDNGRGGRSTTNPEYNSGRPSSESVTPPSDRYARPSRAQQPQGDGNYNQRRSTYSNESTQPSQPTYSAPQRRMNDNNTNSSPSYSSPRPTRSSYDGGSNSGGSYNSGRSSGSSSGGSAPSRSSSGGGSSSGSSRPPRR